MADLKVFCDCGKGQYWCINGCPMPEERRTPPPAPAAQGPNHCGFCQSAPCQCPHNDSDIPSDVADELFRAASANGRIRYEWLCDIYRKGRDAARPAPVPPAAQGQERCQCCDGTGWRDVVIDDARRSGTHPCDCMEPTPDGRWVRRGDGTV